MAHASGGLGPWARYEAATDIVVDVIGPSSPAIGDLGLVGGAGWLRFGRSSDLDSFDLDQDVRLGANGNLGMVRRREADDRIARTLLDTYLLGDARVSAAAGRELEERARSL